jgi:sugar phosphate isomerase/epimerase
MKFGYCASIDHAQTLADIGYDYIEPPLVTTLQPESDSDEFDRIVNLPIPAEAFNIFLPGGLKITGPDVNIHRQKSYVISAMKRAAKIGAKVIVFGSAGARNVPDGFSHDEAISQIVTFLKMVGPIAQSHKITVVIEPLNKGESNIINSVSEALDLVREIYSPNVEVLSDLYHVSVENQTFHDTAAAAKHLVHVHVAGAEDRRSPISEDIHHLTQFFANLKAIGYDQRISIEGKCINIAESAKVGLDVLKEAWERA